MKIRRARDMVCFWTEEGLQVIRPPSSVRLQLSARVTTLLTDLASWTAADDPALRRHDFTGPELAQTIASLREAGIVETDDQPEARRDYLSPWAAWGPFAETYHAASRDASYVIGGPASAELDRELTSAAPMPAPFKTYPDAPALFLPRVFETLSMPVHDALAKRRTHRDFVDEETPLDAFATMLHYTFAPLRFIAGGDFGVLPLKASASGGARHEAECYVVPLRVEGVPLGLYHYDTMRHALELLDPDFTADGLSRLVCDHEPLTHCGFVCFTTAVTSRLTWKYRHPRAYRLCLLDAGHYAQTFAVAATALGLGAFQTIAFRDSETERALGVSGTDELAVYVLAAGHPVTAPSGLPARYRHPGYQQSR
jgi:SagB-type dehydrogenase family enzyme